MKYFYIVYTNYDSGDIELKRIQAEDGFSAYQKLLKQNSRISIERIYNEEELFEYQTIM